MKKLTATEILEIVKANMTESEFAYNNVNEPENFEYSKEYKDLVEQHKTLQNELKAHPMYQNYREQSKDVSYIAIQEKIRKLPSYYQLGKNEILDFLGLGEMKEVSHYGGEGEGETWYSVKYFKDHDVYIRIDGYYQSYDGTTFDEGYGVEVRPKEKTITVYE
jgi:hypothetical protein